MDVRLATERLPGNIKLFSEAVDALEQVLRKAETLNEAGTDVPYRSSASFGYTPRACVTYLAHVATTGDYFGTLPLSPRYADRFRIHFSGSSTSVLNKLAMMKDLFAICFSAVTRVSSVSIC
jgi:hypothetical protein